MRNLRKAAVVAAMVGSISMLGAGVASADDASHYGGGNGADPALCHQEIHQGTVQNGLINIADVGLGLLGNGSAPARANQQICANGPVFAENEAESGENDNFLLLDVL